MKLKLVSFELAKRLKEVGFINKFKCTCGGYPECICDKTKIQRPTLELAKMWFREKYNIIISCSKYRVGYNTMSDGCQYCYHWTWEINIHPFNEDGHFSPEEEGYPGSYEKALEEGLLKACELIK